jgi:hypothetical protein
MRPQLHRTNVKGKFDALGAGLPRSARPGWPSTWSLFARVSPGMAEIDNFLTRGRLRCVIKEMTWTPA